MEKVRALGNWRESDIFSAREKIVLEYAEAVTLSGEQVTEELVEELHAHFDEDGIVELTALIAFQNLSSKFNSALDLPAQGFCEMRSAQETKEKKNNKDN